MARSDDAVQIGPDLAPTVSAVAERAEEERDVVMLLGGNDLEDDGNFRVKPTLALSCVVCFCVKSALIDSRLKLVVYWKQLHIAKMRGRFSSMRNNPDYYF